MKLAELPAEWGNSVHPNSVIRVAMDPKTFTVYLHLDDDTLDVVYKTLPLAQAGRAAVEAAINAAF